MATALWAVFRWGQSSISQRLLTALLLVTSFEEIAGVWLMLCKINNLWLSNLYTLIECCFFLAIFYLWKTKKLQKRIIVVLGISFIVFWIVSKFTFEPFTRDDTYSSAIAKIIYISIAIWILFDVLQDSQSVLKNDVRVWVTAGVIIYSSGSLILFTLFDLLVNSSPELLKALWSVNWILCIITVLLYARGIWCRVSQ